jgi:hypothetical protein
MPFEIPARAAGKAVWAEPEGAGGTARPGAASVSPSALGNALMPNGMACAVDAAATSAPF